MNKKYMKFNWKIFWDYNIILHKKNIWFSNSLINRISKNSNLFLNLNFEIFLENESIYIWLSNQKINKNLDIFNTEEKNHLNIIFDKLNLIYNSENYLYINYMFQNKNFTKKIEIKTLNIESTKKSNIDVYYKIIYNKDIKKYFILELSQNWNFYNLKMKNNLIEKPIKYDFEKFAILINEFTINWKKQNYYYYIDQELYKDQKNIQNDEKYLIWDYLEKYKINKNFMNNQNYNNSKRTKWIINYSLNWLFYKWIYKKDFNEIKKEYINNNNYYFYYLLSIFVWIILILSDVQMSLIIKFIIWWTSLLFVWTFWILLGVWFFKSYFNSKNLEIYNDKNKFIYNL